MEQMEPTAEFVLEQVIAANTAANAAPAEGSRPSSAPYNFARSGQISNEQMRAIAMVNDGIARNLTHTLGAWLRSQMQVSLASTEQMTYTEYLASLPDPSYVCLLRLEPLGGVGLLELDLSLALTIIDVLLGGKGTADQQRDVTDIEEAILASVLAIVMRELNAAWDAVGLKFTLDKREGQAHITRLMPASERMLLVSLDVQMQETQGRLKLCLPTVVLNTIHRRLIAVKEKPRRDFEGGSARVTELMGRGKVRATLRLPPTRISSREIQALEPGYVVQFALPKYTPAELLVGRVRLGAAVPVGQGDHRAALIERRAKRRPSQEEFHSSTTDSEAGEAQ
jgi:flagellar motor switch protein FliM